MSTNKEKQKRQWFSILLIGAGGAMLLAYVIFQGASYPWAALFSRWGLTQTALPSDPAPLPATPSMSVPIPEGTPGAASDIGDIALPSQPESVFRRPEVYLKSLGVIKIPAMSLSENIVEGQEEELLYGVGHTPGTALPGQEGNCVLAGHRNYIIMRPFRYLDWLKEEDLVYLIDEENMYTYEVYEIFTIDAGDIPEASWVMQPIEEESHALTLITCTPVMNPVNRLIVRCRLIETTPFQNQ